MMKYTLLDVELIKIDLYVVGISLMTQKEGQRARYHGKFDTRRKLLIYAQRFF